MSLINRKSPPPPADRPLCVQMLSSGGPAALDLSGCFLLAGPEEREGDRNGLRWGRGLRKYKCRETERRKARTSLAHSRHSINNLA